MAAGNVIVYDVFKQYLMDGTVTLGTNTIKVALLTATYTPNLATHKLFGDVSNELTTANGYTAGGAALAGGTVNFDASANTTTFTATATTWTASGGNIGPFTYAVLYASGTLNGHVNPLIGYCKLDPSSLTIIDGNSLTVTWSASGILSISGATS